MSEVLRKYLYISIQSLYFFIFAVFNVVLLLFRIFYFKSDYYNFLIWNLFLAFIPYLISKIIFLRYYRNRKFPDLVFITLVGAWIVFLPNAPYILTDLFHLKSFAPIPLWYDLILISSFALNGLFIGLHSLNIMQVVITQKSRLLSWTFTLLSLFLCSFGIYIGRYLRWNSWNILTNPYHLFIDLKEIFTNPLINKGIYGFSLFFTCLLVFVYLAIYIPKKY